MGSLGATSQWEFGRLPSGIISCPLLSAGIPFLTAPRQWRSRLDLSGLGSLPASEGAKLLSILHSSWGRLQRPGRGHPAGARRRSLGAAAAAVSCSRPARRVPNPAVLTTGVLTDCHNRRWRSRLTLATSSVGSTQTAWSPQVRSIMPSWAPVVQTAGTASTARWLQCQRF